MTQNSEKVWEFGEHGECPECGTDCRTLWEEQNRKPAVTRNSEALASFVAYCQANPDLRFWQALLNWSNFAYIIGSPTAPDWGNQVDTYNIEGLDGTRKVE